MHALHSKTWASNAEPQESILKAAVLKPMLYNSLCPLQCRSGLTFDQHGSWNKEVPETGSVQPSVGSLFS